MRLAALLLVAAVPLVAATPASATCVATRVHHVCVTEDGVCVGSTRPPDLCVPLR